MRKFLFLAAAFMLFAGAAHAGTLDSATWVGDFQGTPFTLTTAAGDGLVASGTSTGSDANVSVSVTPQFFSLLNTTGAAPVYISQTLGGSQTIAVGAGGAPANQGVGGLLNVFIGTDNQGILLFTVPLSVGVTPGGSNPFFTTKVLVPGFNIPVSVTATAFGWQTSAFSFASSTSSGVAIPTPFTAVGGNTLTAQGGGTVTLIAPSITRVCAGGLFTMFPCDGGSQVSLGASVTTLTLNFVPEPGTALLLGAGLVGLAALGRRRA